MVFCCSFVNGWQPVLTSTRAGFLFGQIARKSEPFPVGTTKQPCSAYCERFVVSHCFQSGIVFFGMYLVSVNFVLNTLVYENTNRMESRVKVMKRTKSTLSPHRLAVFDKKVAFYP